MWESVGLYKCITLDTNLSPNIQISTEPVFLGSSDSGSSLIQSACDIRDRVTICSKAALVRKATRTNIHALDHSLTMNPLCILCPTPQYIVMFLSEYISLPELFL